MGRKKSQLLMRDQYGCLVVARRAAQVIRTRLSGVEGPHVLRVEDARYEPWGDLTEEHRNELGAVTEHVWQVKRQHGALTREDMETLLGALARYPAVRAHLALYSMVDVTSLGPLGVLADLCARLQEVGLDMGGDLALSKKERVWIQLIQRLLGSSSELDALKLLGRLELHTLGAEREYRQGTQDLLDRYVENAEQVHQRLMAFLAAHADGAIPMTFELLEAKVLSGVTRRLVSGSASLALEPPCVREDVASADAPS
ncbi:hypothetical protein HUA74_20750 [Myxococcus sp. CA051A]|uniref:hypothetical protein n=1 Tax=Myxococcus sp. CA051A TaxID=2741739 RepID=UPI00157B748D|nr:hypothetical protein [Myxococcus sp. CA051A]NTX63082.1 hypothetical protein [Myxococcus sp. CA051A]